MGGGADLGLGLLGRDRRLHLRHRRRRAGRGRAMRSRLPRRRSPGAAGGARRPELARSGCWSAPSSGLALSTTAIAVAIALDGPWRRDRRRLPAGRLHDSPAAGGLRDAARALRAAGRADRGQRGQQHDRESRRSSSVLRSADRARFQRLGDPGLRHRRWLPALRAVWRAAAGGRDDEREGGDREPKTRRRAFRRRSATGFALSPATEDCAVVALMAAQTFVDGALGVLTAVAALELLHTGDAGIGYLNSAGGIGAIVGSIVAAGMVGSRLAPGFATGPRALGAADRHRRRPLRRTLRR